jgi:hypothetical protein
MATYREIHGKAVKSVSTDPSAETDAGQIWYNTSSDTFKSILNIEAWASAAPIITARGYIGGITGTASQTAGLIFGGNENPGASTKTEEYNGSGWSSSGVLGTGRLSIAGFGIQTAAVGMGGRTAPAGQVNTTEEYDGSSWTAGGSLSTARRYLSGAGTLTSGLAFAGTTGGAPGAGTPQTVTEEYDGSSWTSGGALNTARQRGCGTGASQTAAICFGGSVPPVTGNTEVYDGSSWSEQNNMNSGKASGMGFGLSTSAVSTGGETSTASYTATTELWDGTSWTSNPATIATGNQAMAGQGSSTAGIIAGGWKPAPVGNTAQEWNSTANIVTAGAWASGPSRVNTLTNVASADGTPSAWLVWGGREAPATPPYAKTTSEEFNGTAFSNTPSLNTGARDRLGGGTEPAAWAAGGAQPAYLAATEEYNGSSWSSVEDMPAAAAGVGAFGVQTAGIWVVGQISPGPYPNAALSYDGTDWTVGPALNTSRTNAGGGAVGTSTAGLLGGGEAPPGVISNVEEWGGSSWTSVNSMITGVGQNSDGAFGIQTNAIFTGGKTSPSPGNGITTAQAYDGTTWSTSPSLGQARKLATDGGTASSGIITSGQATNEASALSSSEQWTPESTAINVKTLTQS